MNGITYFRLNSQYSGDITKNCALNGSEVDNNFYTLEGRDIESVTVEGNDLLIKLMNGRTLKAKDVRDTNAVSDIDFDQSRGVLSFVKNGERHEIGGFTTKVNSGATVSVDGTLTGNGTPSKPIGVAVSAQTGQYKPVDEILDFTVGQKLPDKHKLLPGTRFLTKETISNYGMLYDYNAVKRIACDLRDSHSEWRIPTKEDWDDMLNAIEPCSSDRTHASAANNKYLGKWSGKLLKSVDMWKEDCHMHPHFDDEDGTCFNYDEELGHSCECNHENTCTPAKYCGEMHHHHHGHDHHHHVRPDSCGIDEYGFRITPAGYADDGENFAYFSERAYFWTASNSKFTSAYAKRFEFDKSSVHQDILASQNHLSLRLVKNYNGDNFNERENILGNAYSTVLMPSTKGGHSIWTSVNFASSNRSYEPVMPNDGQGLTMIELYFINEWDGHKWVRNSFKEGESVVVKNAPEGKTNVEYSLYNGELVSVLSKVQETVMSAVGNELEDINIKLNEEIVRSNRVDNELRDSIEQINNDAAALTERVDAVQSELEQDTEKINDLYNKVDETNVNLANFISEANDFKTQTEENFTTVNESIANEKSERENSDENLINRIEEVNTIVEANTQAIADEVSARQEAVTAEETVRNEADEILQGNIDALKEQLDNVNNANEEAFAEVNSALEAEAAAREALEETLNTKIDEQKAELDEKIAEVEGKLIVEEGTSFDEETGVITLKSGDGTNDIEIQVRANFGTF